MPTQFQIPDQDKPHWIDFYKNKLKRLEIELSETTRFLNELQGIANNAVPTNEDPDYGKKGSIGWKEKVSSVLENNGNKWLGFRDIHDGVLQEYPELEAKGASVKNSISSHLATNSGDGKFYLTKMENGVKVYKIYKP